MLDETQGTGGPGAPGRAAGAAPEPVVEDNGPWWVVFIVTFIFLFASAFAFLVHSLLVTFGTGIPGA